MYHQACLLIASFLGTVTGYLIINHFVNKRPSYLSKFDRNELDNQLKKMINLNHSASEALEEIRGYRDTLKNLEQKTLEKK